jgi:hypothetical protein
MVEAGNRYNPALGTAYEALQAAARVRRGERRRALSAV